MFVPRPRRLTCGMWYANFFEIQNVRQFKKRILLIKKAPQKSGDRDRSRRPSRIESQQRINQGRIIKSETKQGVQKARRQKMSKSRAVPTPSSQKQVIGYSNEKIAILGGSGNSMVIEYSMVIE